MRINSDTDLRELMSQSPSSIEKIGVRGGTVLHLAAMFGAHDVIDNIVSIHPQISEFIDKRDDCMWTALHYAVFYGCYDCACLLIEHNADWKQTAGVPETPIKELAVNHQKVTKLINYLELNNKLPSDKPIKCGPKI